MPLTSGSSGPTTTIPMSSRPQNFPMPSKSRGDRSTLVPHCVVPALPGAMYRAEQWLLCASFQASACSRPPEPNKSIFINRAPKFQLSAQIEKKNLPAVIIRALQIGKYQYFVCQLLSHESIHRRQGQTSQGPLCLVYDGNVGAFRLLSAGGSTVALSSGQYHGRQGSARKNRCGYHRHLSGPHLVADVHRRDDSGQVFWLYPERLHWRCLSRTRLFRADPPGKYRHVHFAGTHRYRERLFQTQYQHAARQYL